MKKLFLVLATLGLALGSVYAGYVILDNELEPYAKSAEVVSSVRDLTRDIELEEGDNVSIAVSNNTISIAADVPAQVQADWTEVDSGSPAYIAHKPTIPTVPTVVSAFSNDAGYVTASAIPTVPTNVSAFNNDVGYITSDDVPTVVSAYDNDAGYITYADIPAPDWTESDTNSPAYIYHKPTIPTVPTNVSAFSNDAGYITSAGIPAQVQSDWSETNSASPAYINHKPALITSNEVSEIARGIAREVVDEMTSAGWEVDGTWYKLVVQSFVPPPPAKTTFKLSDGTEGTYDIVGNLDRQWMIDNGWYDGNNYTWLATITSANIGTNVTSIGGYAFSMCTGLTSVTIPDGVTSIGDSAFDECRGLTSVTIPNSVTSLVADAFYNCSGLTSVTIGDGVTSIGGSAFYGCSGLTSVTIPNSVTSIGATSFYNCNGMTNVVIGSGVTNIGYKAFSLCSSLMSVTISGKTTTQVSGMGNYPWGLFRGCVITCSDGTLTR